MTRDHPAAPTGVPTLGDIFGAIQRGAAVEARKGARALLAAEPGNWTAWHLASIASTSGNAAPPLDAFQRAVRLAPERGELWATFAAALERHHALGPARAAAHRALVLVPSVPEAMINLGAVLKDDGDTLHAGAWLDRAAMLMPGNPAALNNRALIHMERGELPKAREALHRALTAAPLDADARLNLAIVERRQERPSLALQIIVGALTLVPSDSAYLAELGTILVTVGEAGEGVRWLKRALAADPGNDAATASCLGALAYVPDVTEAERARLYGAAADRMRGGAPVAPRPAPHPSRADRRLTLGFVSANWHAHPMTWQFLEVLQHRRRDRVRAVAYADLKRRDDMTARLNASVDDWRETTGLSDARVAEMIRADGVDVLLFLALHEDGSRRSLPTLRAAPVQVSHYDIATSGLAEIDAWITDPALHPPGGTEWFAEALASVPSLFLFPALPDLAAAPPPGPGVRFASFNNPAKLARPVLLAWAEILRRVSEATLFLKYRTLYEDPAVLGRVRGMLAAHGVDPTRVSFGAHTLSLGEHLAQVASADIVLDPFPFNGNTATIEALWMGVPVVSLAGSRFVGRMGADILSKVGLADLVAEDLEGYVRTAVRLALDVPRRASLRRELRAAVRGSLLADAAAHTRALEELLIGLDRDRRAAG